MTLAALAGAPASLSACAHGRAARRQAPATVARVATSRGAASAGRFLAAASHPRAAAVRQRAAAAARHAASAYTSHKQQQRAAVPARRPQTPRLRRGVACKSGNDDESALSKAIHSALGAGFGSVLLLAVTALSLYLANAPGASGESYRHLWEIHVGPKALGLNMALKEWINEGLMAVFFFVVGLDIKREFVHGSLASIRKAALPCLGALGGMIAPMAVFCAMNMQPGGVLAGWAIPMATDIAFAMGVYNFFRNRMPAGVAAFLLTLATVDDLGAIVVIAVCFAKNLVVPYVAGAAACCGALLLLSKNAVYNVKAYAAIGVVLWYCLLMGGINADVAGVAAALAVPAGARGLEKPGKLIDDLLHTLEPYSAIIIMPLFAMANTAVFLDTTVVNSLLTAPVSQGIALGFLIGKPLGIVGLSLLGIKLGIASWPSGMKLNHLATVGMLGGIGFTMSLFLIEQSLTGMTAATAKLAVLAGSVTAALIGVAAMATMKPLDEQPGIAAAAA